MSRRHFAPPPPWARGLCYKAAFLGGNAAVFSIIYSVPGILNVGPDETRDTTAETFLWLTSAAAAAAYFFLQGSEPGYVTARASERAPAPQVAALEEIAVGVQQEGSVELTRIETQLASSASTGPLAGAPKPVASPPAVPLAASAAADAQAVGAPRLHADSEDRAARVLTLLAEHDAAAACAIACSRPCQAPSCRVLQPPRSHHCRSCEKCVATFDHHCSVLGTCIGERNRARFWLYVFFQSTALAVAIGILNTSFVWRRTLTDWVGQNALTLVTLLVLWVLQLFVFGLLAFHSWLAITNTTTFETVTGARRLWYLAGTNPKDCDLPYSNGICNNLRLFFCELEGWPCAVRRGAWAPRAWHFPGVIDRESDDFVHNAWENRYYACCG